ncbi:hypothetical protein NA898_16415 [Proteus cibi]|uniref:Uncharacterized protein n=1 Tax=Proteus cibi TaxID=2050966 RepID=A0ABU6EHB8_9GAMM|nr:hypothetical protein [Proteus cibi]MEB6858462.1 hypothetical protein [Proteus cibi]MEB7090115.1 hypothetical protein [Proteus cibi]
MKDYFLNVKLERCDFNQSEISPKGMVRLIASGKNFYLNDADFANSQDFLKRLKQDDELKICAELLKDGSFWVQWIYHDTKGRLEPERKFTLTAKQQKWLLLAFILTVIGGGWSYYSLLYLDVNFLIVVSMVISFGAVMVGVSYIGEKVYRYFQRTRPKHRKRIKALDNVIAKQDIIAPDGEQLVIPHIKTVSLPKRITRKNLTFHIKDNKVQRVRGKIKLHHVDRIKIHSRNSETVIMQISCLIDKHPFVFSYRERLFYSDHNLFLADGDDVELFFWQAEDKNSGPIVLGVYNHTDNGAYSISGQMYIGHQRTKRLSLLITGLISAFIFSIFTILSISDVYDNGNYWDKWDWFFIGDTFLGMGIIFSSIITGFAFLIALFSNLYILLSQKGNSSYQTYFLLQQQCVENKRTVYITELSQ